MGDDPDDVGILLLANITLGQRLLITDNGAFADGTLRRNEGVLSFTAAQDVPIGTVLKLAHFGAAVEDRFALSASGDQVTVFVGAVDSPAYLCAATFKGAWRSSASS